MRGYRTRLTRRTSLHARITGAAVLLVAAAAVAGGDAVTMGEAEFMNRCALCHGMDAEGGGPYSRMLVVEPPDLTVLARDNGGRFPFSLVYDAIDGRDMTHAHGSRSMPVWGRIWSSAPEAASATLVRGRILEIIIYLRSMQR